MLYIGWARSEAQGRLFPFFPAERVKTNEEPSCVGRSSGCVVGLFDRICGLALRGTRSGGATAGGGPFLLSGRSGLRLPGTRSARGASRGLPGAGVLPGTGVLPGPGGLWAARGLPGPAGLSGAGGSPHESLRPRPPGEEPGAKGIAVARTGLRKVNRLRQLAGNNIPTRRKRLPQRAQRHTEEEEGEGSENQATSLNAPFPVLPPFLTGLCIIRYLSVAFSEALLTRASLCGPLCAAW